MSTPHSEYKTYIEDKMLNDEVKIENNIRSDFSAAPDRINHTVPIREEGKDDKLLLRQGSDTL